MRYGTVVQFVSDKRIHQPSAGTEEGERGIRGESRLKANREINRIEGCQVGSGFPEQLGTQIGQRGRSLSRGPGHNHRFSLGSSESHEGKAGFAVAAVNPDTRGTARAFVKEADCIREVSQVRRGQRRRGGFRKFDRLGLWDCPDAGQRTRCEYSVPHFEILDLISDRDDPADSVNG